MYRYTAVINSGVVMTAVVNGLEVATTVSSSQVITAIARHGHAHYRRYDECQWLPRCFILETNFVLTTVIDLTWMTFFPPKQYILANGFIFFGQSAQETGSYQVKSFRNTAMLTTVVEITTLNSTVSCRPLWYFKYLISMPPYNLRYHKRTCFTTALI